MVSSLRPKRKAPHAAFSKMSTGRPAKRSGCTRSGSSDGATLGSAAIPSLPPLAPLLSSCDVLFVIFGFLDGQTLHAASGVSKSFQSALVPRQKTLSLSGFVSQGRIGAGDDEAGDGEDCLSTLRSLATAGPSRRYNFASVEFLSFRNCGRSETLVADATLRNLAADYGTVLPNLKRIDVTGCKNVSSLGVRAMVKALGDNFEGLVQSRILSGMQLCKDMKVTPATIKAVAAAPNLRKLDVILPTKCQADNPCSSEQSCQPREAHSHL